MNNIIKKCICLFLCIIVFLGFSCNFYGLDSEYQQPYESGTANSHLFRIPAMITLENGEVIVSADIRYGDGTDSPANIDTGVRYSDNNGKSWSQINIINHFYDFDDECSEKVIKSSASFIDSALLQSSAGTVFLICDACPAFIGSTSAKKCGNGFIDGKIVLCNKTTEKELENTKLSKDNYPYYIDKFTEGFAPVKKFENNEIYNNYYVDEEYNLYHKNGNIYDKIMIYSFNNKGEKTEKLIHSNIFYACSPLKIYPAFYTWLRRSEDFGRTWSKPYILNDQISTKGFTGVCPGKGFKCDINGNERLIFGVYDNNDGWEKTSIIYSDDNGVSWNRGQKVKVGGPAHKTSESQIVMLNNNTLRMFSRNASNYIGYEDSSDGGITWTRHFTDSSLKYCSDCMVSFINYSGLIDGKNAIIASFPSTAKRKLGVIKVGLIDENNNIDWAYEYKVTYSTNSFSFVYSCLTELPDGKIGLLYESDAAEITYTSFSIDELTAQENKVKNYKKIFRKIFNAILHILAYI